MSAPLPPGARTRVMAKGQGTLTAFGHDDAFVYWARTDGRVMRAPFAGGEPATVTTLDESTAVTALLPAPEGLYLAIAASGMDALRKGKWGSGAILRVAYDSGKAETLATGLMTPSGLAVDEAKVYWTAFKGSDKKGSWFVFAAPRAGARVGKAMERKLESELGLVILRGVHGGDALLNWPIGGIVAQPFGKGEGKHVAPIWGVHGVAIDGDRMVVAGEDIDTEAHGKSVSKIGFVSLANPANDLDVVTTLPDGERATAVALLGDEVYFARRGTSAKGYKDGAIVRVSLKDRTPVVVASDQYQPADIVATPHGVAWANERGNTVSTDGDAEIVMLAP